ncbi:D-2-hydroxyacid dehydrogenase [Clostridium sp.]|uniref:D-2-hydroxyacid dehydrogenase n=1 Tax=Clostridium sp. TaxID=1506 RepID=UPI001A5D59E6|nr:D-2-hydroxyacid dehydrogenase [Clostridium sp.]MBK5243221.1 D-2-hydroxyacid dehydrogenase [Clostridium sp.]
MKMVVLDGYTLNPGDISWEGLKQLGELKVYDRVTSDPNETEIIIESVGDAEVIFTNKTPLTREILKNLPNVKFIGVLATGYNVVDVKAAKDLGIVVTNIPSYGTAAVSQTAIALLLEICHHVGEHNRAVKNKEWSNCVDYCFWNYPLIELDGKTMGIIGLGRIGKATAKIAQAMGLSVIAYDEMKDRSLETESLKYVELDELYAKSDVIVLHCPQFDSNKGMINKESISKMKDGVIIINNSRGLLINEEDLASALESGKVAGAGVDVVSEEPIRENNSLLEAKNCIITPHLSWAPVASRKRLMDIGVDNLKAYIDGNPINVVNK